MLSTVPVLTLSVLGWSKCPVLSCPGRDSGGDQSESVPGPDWAGAVTCCNGGLGGGGIRADGRLSCLWQRSLRRRHRSMVFDQPQCRVMRHCFAGRCSHPAVFSVRSEAPRMPKPSTVKETRSGRQSKVRAWCKTRLSCGDRSYIQGVSPMLPMRDPGGHNRKVVSLLSNP